MIPIYKPYLPHNSLHYAHDAIDSTWLSSQGKYIQMATEKLQDIMQAKYVLLVNNGTSACHLVAKAVKEKHNKSQIIVPNNVYAAAWNAFMFDFNWDLISVATDLSTWNYDLEALDQAITASPHAAVLIVHNIGNIINVPELQQKYPSTVFIEDNCEGFCGTYNGLQSGTASFASAISFFGNKNITCGEGGAFITNDEETYQFIKKTHNQGQSNQRFVHDVLGYNYRMTNIQAALLLGQLEILPEILCKKHFIFDIYRATLKDHDKIVVQTIAPNTTHANWMFGVRVLGKRNYQSAELYFKQHGIEVRPMFYPIYQHKHLVEYSCLSWIQDLDAETLNEQCIILPSYPELTYQDQMHILKTLNDYAKEE